MRRFLPWILTLGTVFSCADTESPSPATLPPDLTQADTESPGPATEPLDLTQDWTYTTPEAVQVDALDDLTAKAESFLRLTGAMVVRNGRIIYEEYFKGYKRDSLHDVRSVTKSVVSLLTGLAIQEGFVKSVYDPIGLYLSKFELRDEVKAITIDNLLTMSGGFEWNELNGNAYNEWISSERYVEFLLEKPLVAVPGTIFNYNSAAGHLLGVIIAEASGMALPDFAQQYFFSRLGIEEVGWEQAGENYVNGGSGIRLKLEDMARIGQLILQRGASGGRQILPKEWVDFIVGPAYSWRNTYGYLNGYTYGRLWWVHDGGEPDAVFAWGYGGQHIYIAPSKELIIVITTNWMNSSALGAPQAAQQEAFDLIINDILPRVH